MYFMAKSYLSIGN